MRTKAKEVKAWALTCPAINELKTNAIVNDMGDSAIFFNTQEKSVVTYIDGSEVRDIIFGLQYVLPWSDDGDDINDDALGAVNGWLEWVSEQYPHNVPDFGEDCTIISIEPQQNMSELVQVDQGTARYSVAASIRYLERG